VVEKPPSTDCSADISGQAHGALLSRPAHGKHIVFDGRFLQAAPSELSLWDGTEQKATQRLIVSVWLNWKPRDAVRCPEAVATQMASQPVPLDFGGEQEIAAVPTDTADPNPTEATESSGAALDTIEWQFEAEAARQTAVMTFTFNADLIRRMGAQSGASLLLQSPLPPGGPEIVRFRTAQPPILATGFHSGVAKTVNHLFEWTEQSLCEAGTGAGTGAGAGSGASASGAHGDGQAMPTGDAKLTKCDESTLFPGLFLSGPQVRQSDQILCFVYKYRQRFAIIMNEIATRLGLETEKVVAECRKQHMFLDDLSCCKATCGSCGEQSADGEPPAGPFAPREMESSLPLVRVEAKARPRKRKREEAPAS